MRILTPTHCYRALLLGTVLLLSPACKEKPENGSARTGPIRVGVLPDRSPESLRRTYGPLVEFLEEHSGLELDLWLPGDYQELTAAFDDGRVDVARFGGVTFVQAERDSGARPLVLRDVDLNFTTDFLVAAATA